MRVHFISGPSSSRRPVTLHVICESKIAERHGSFAPYCRRSRLNLPNPKPAIAGWPIGPSLDDHRRHNLNRRAEGCEVPAVWRYRRKIGSGPKVCETGIISIVFMFTLEGLSETHSTVSAMSSGSSGSAPS